MNPRDVDSRLSKLFGHIQRECCHEFNPLITRGLAFRQMQGVEQYVDSVLRCAAKGFPPELKYIRMERCLPHEAFAVATMKRNNRQHYELTRSDVFLVKLFFEFQGEPMKERYLYLPFVSEAGLITIMDSKFCISPVLADKAISVSEDSLFIPFNRDKLTFKRQLQHYKLDNQRVSQHVVWSVVHHAMKNSRRGLTTRKTINALSILAHYLFCKYGLQGSFLKFCNAQVYVGNPYEVNEETYPPHEWHICESTRDKPYGIRGKFYTGTDIRLAIRRCDYNQSTSALIAGFFYIADRFPERMITEDLQDHTLWRRLMGHVIYASDESEGKLLNKIDIHMESLDGYVDGMVQEWLFQDGIVVSDLYELFWHIIETYPKRITESAQEVASMYGKQLMVLRYVLLDIVKAAFNTMYAVQVAAKKGLTKNDVISIMNKNLKPNIIIHINHQHSEVASVSSPSDCMAFKVTSNVVLQSNITNGGGSSSTITVDASRKLHASIAEVGQFNNLPKGEPTGRNRINPHAKISEFDLKTIERDPAKAELIDRTQRAFVR